MPTRSFDSQPPRKRVKIRHNNTTDDNIANKRAIASETESASAHNLTWGHVDNMHRVSSDTENNDKLSDSSIKVEYLKSPSKSDNDKKDYRVIKLPNGLTALLISDTHFKTTNEDEELSVNEINAAPATLDIDNDDVSDEGEDNEDDLEDDESDESDGTADEDDENRQAVKCSKKDEKMAACALCVSVGSFSDPPEIPGLAHFLEHMVFMGSKKYSKENDFDAFIKKAGGSDNAHTDCEHTTFYFEVDEKYFFPSLDRFAQFFVSPLLLRDSISREREAVESEFQMALPSDAARKVQLFGSLAIDEHPAAKFSWGNLKTLRDNVTDDYLYKELHEFHKRHYNAHRMTLAIQSRLSLDKLENYVTECFSGVPNNKMPADDFSRFVGAKSFDTVNYRRIYKIKPTKDVCRIDMSWVMPPMLHLYRSKPLQYVFWVIGHGGKGSLISYLRKKMWCLDIYSGNSGCGFEFNSMYSLLTLTFILTDEGYVHLKEVLDAVFSYINMMVKLGPQKRIYDEIRKIEEINFKFVDEEAPFDYVENLSENMQYYDPPDYITGDDLFFEYKPDAIQACMDALTPDNFNLMISNKKFDDTTFEKIEPWFGTKYTDEEIPNDWINDWRTIEPRDEFHLPEPNIYVTDDFSLIPEVTVPHPMKIHQSALTEIWYKPDSKFRLPECYMYLHFISPVMENSPDGYAMTDMMILILKLQLIEELYPAAMAQLQYSLATCESGVMLKIHGLNQKLPLLLEKICTYIVKCSELTTEGLFELIKTQQLKEYYNTILKPKKLGKEARYVTLMLKQWSVLDKNIACMAVTLEQFRQFTKNFMNHVYIKCLVQGNMTSADTIQHLTRAFDILQCKPLLPNTYPEMRTLSLPAGSKFLRMKNFNEVDSNSIVINYYQSDLASIKLGAILDLLIMIMEEPLFNQLRTQEQLGYDVSCMIRHTFGVLGYSITVCTQASKFSMDHIDTRIEEFLKSFREIVEKMTDDELQPVKESLIKVKLCMDIHLKEETDKNWSEIISGQYVFDRESQEVDAIRKIDVAELRSWLENHSSQGTNYRKLSVQVVGVDTSKCEENSVAMTDEKVKNEEKKIPYTFEYLSHLPEDKEPKSIDEFIMDINQFKQGLYAYPVHPKTVSIRLDVE